jgi:hypothetical protein
MIQPENPCLEFFERNLDNRQKVELLWRECSRVEWETVSASKHSPGPVSVGEQLVRCVISPIHIDAASGEIKLSFVSDVKDKGLSSDRLAHTSIEDALKRGEAVQQLKNEALKPPEQRLIQGHWVVHVSAIRNLHTLDGERTFGIYDTGSDNNPAHADICQLVQDKQSARRARWDLFALTKQGYVKFRA